VFQYLHKPSLFGSFHMSFPLKLHPMRISVFQPYIWQDRCSCLSPKCDNNWFINFLCTTVISSCSFFFISLNIS
jgi:hypothetical protein